MLKNNEMYEKSFLNKYLTLLQFKLLQYVKYKCDNKFVV